MQIYGKVYESWHEVYKQVHSLRWLQNLLTHCRNLGAVWGDADLLVGELRANMPWIQRNPRPGSSSPIIHHTLKYMSDTHKYMCKETRTWTHLPNCQDKQERDYNRAAR